MEKQASISEEMLKNPYPKILNWADSRLHLMGALVFQYIALQPPSLILPSIPYRDSPIPTRLNFLLLSPSGSGKSTLSNMFKDITYTPLHYERMTQAGLEEEIKSYARFSLITGDVGRIFRDVNLLKLIEGIIGEEGEMSALTFRKKLSGHVHGIFTGFGLPNSLTKYASCGLLQRIATLLVFHTQEEQNQIAEWITNNIGNEREDVAVNEIKSFYQELLKIQKGVGKIKKIEGFVIEDKFKGEIFNLWEKLTKSLDFPEDKYMHRELHLGFKLMVSYSFLNVFNRQVEKNKLVIDRKDVDMALELLEKEMRIKHKILKYVEGININSREDISFYRRLMRDEKIGEFDRKLISSILREKLTK